MRQEFKYALLKIKFPHGNVFALERHEFRNGKNYAAVGQKLYKLVDRDCPVGDFSSWEEAVVALAAQGWTVGEKTGKIDLGWRGDAVVSAWFVERTVFEIRDAEWREASTEMSVAEGA